MDDGAPRRPRAQALREHLPAIYADSRQHAEVFAALGYEFDQMRFALDQILLSAMPGHPLFPAWAADQWERDLGLSVQTNWPLADRVARILAHLRGFGTATRWRVAAVANSFQNGQVVVLEDYASYTVTFRFASVRGEPPFFDAVQAAVGAIVPAHLLVVWEFTYTTYGMLTAEHYSFASLGALVLTYEEISVFL